MGSGGTTNQTVTHLALLALRAADGVFWSEGGARKSKAGSCSVNYCTMDSACALLFSRIRGIALEYMVSLDL